MSDSSSRSSSDSGSVSSLKPGWELSKENIQPLAGGRVFSQLRHSFEHSDQREMEVNEKIKELEDNIKKYNGSDPLDPIWRLVSFCEQHCLTGTNSTYEKILKKSVKLFVKDDRYKCDRRFIDILIKALMHETREKRIDIYEAVMSQGVGKLDSKIYLALAENYEGQNNLQKAIQIIKNGIAANAQPIQYLNEALVHLENQVVEELAKKMKNMDCTNERNFGASVPKVGEEAISDRHGLPLADPISTKYAHGKQNSNPKKFDIFQEENTENADPEENQAEAIEINFGKKREIENDLRTEKWTAKDSALPFVNPRKDEPTPIKIYEEPTSSLEVEKIPHPIQIQFAVPPLSERKTEKREEELKVVGGYKQRPMYSKFTRNGKEISFEERRAEIYERRRLAKEAQRAKEEAERTEIERAERAEKEMIEKQKREQEMNERLQMEQEKEKKVNFNRGSARAQIPNHEKVQLESVIEKLNNLLQRSTEEKEVAEGKVTMLGETVELLKSEKDEILKKLYLLEYETDQIRADYMEKTRIATQLTEENDGLVEKNRELEKALEKAEFESETAILDRESLQREIDGLKIVLDAEKQERLSFEFKFNQLNQVKRGNDAERSIYDSAKSFYPGREAMEMASMNTTRFSMTEMPSPPEIEITEAFSAFPADMTNMTRSEFVTSRNFMEPPSCAIYPSRSVSANNVEGAPGQTGPVRKLAFTLYESRMEQSKMAEAIEKSMEEENEDKPLDFRYASLTAAAANKENFFPDIEVKVEEEENKENCYGYLEEKPKRRLSGVLLPSTDAERQELVYEYDCDEEILGQFNKTENFNVSNLTRALNLNPLPMINSTPQRSSFPTRPSMPMSSMPNPGRYQDPHVNSMNYQQNEKTNFTNPYFQGNNLSMIQETSKEAYTTTGSSSSNLTRGSTASSVYFPRSAPRSEGRYIHHN